MQAKEVEALITALVEPILADTEMTLVDVEYVREKDWYLRIFIDKPEGVEIDDCQLVSEKLTAVLDEKDPIPDKYFLEVSSPGIDRPLKKDRDFEHALGGKVEVRLFKPVDGKKLFEGALRAWNAETVTIEDASGLREFPRRGVALIKPVIEIDLDDDEGDDIL